MNINRSNGGGGSQITSASSSHFNSKSATQVPPIPTQFPSNRSSTASIQQRKNFLTHNSNQNTGSLNSERQSFGPIVNNYQETSGGGGSFIVCGGGDLKSHSSQQDNFAKNAAFVLNSARTNNSSQSHLLVTPQLYQRLLQNQQMLKEHGYIDLKICTLIQIILKYLQFGQLFFHIDIPVLPSASLNGIESAETLARQLLIVSELLITQNGSDDERDLLREENDVYRVSLEKSEHIIKNLKGETDYLSSQVEQLRQELNQTQQAVYTSFQANNTLNSQRNNSKEKRPDSKERVGSPKSNWQQQIVQELKAKLRKAEDTIKHMAEEANRRLREVSTLKAECETLKAQGKLSSTAGYVKMVNKLEKIAPRAQVSVNLYQNTKGQLQGESKAGKLCFNQEGLTNESNLSNQFTIIYSFKLNIYEMP